MGAPPAWREKRTRRAAGAPFELEREKNQLPLLPSKLQGRLVVVFPKHFNEIRGAGESAHGGHVCNVPDTVF